LSNPLLINAEDKIEKVLLILNLRNAYTWFFETISTPANHFIWFKRWVLQKDTFDVLVKESGYSKSKLQRIFRSYLSSPPTFIIHQKLRLYLIIDGTYFTEGLCLIIYYDSKLKYILLCRFFHTHQSYCWQVALRHCLLPLQN
jgi:hypothetical protein